MACHLYSTKQEVLNKQWLIINWNSRKKTCEISFKIQNFSFQKMHFGGLAHNYFNSTANTQEMLQSCTGLSYLYEYVIWKLVTILLRPQSVKICCHMMFIMRSVCYLDAPIICWCQPQEKPSLPHKSDSVQTSGKKVAGPAVFNNMKWWEKPKKVASPPGNLSVSGSGIGLRFQHWNLHTSGLQVWPSLEYDWHMKEDNINRFAVF